MTKNILRFLLVSLLICGGGAQSASFDLQARRFSALGDDGRDQIYRQKLDVAWQTYQKHIGNPMKGWADREIAYPGGGTVFYPFSGPDLVTVAQMFSNAERYVLVSMQGARPPAAIDAMSESQRKAFEQKFAREWQKFGRLGFFRTLDLDDDLRDRKGQIGVTTLLMTFAARLGYRVDEVYPIELNPTTGDFEKSAGPWKSVRLSLFRNGKTTLVDYVSADLSDSGVRRSAEMRIWLSRMAHNPVLLKAASHLLQESSFQLLREQLVASAPMVVQDETGLNYSDLVKIGDVALYGSFTRPYALFNQNKQRSLADAYKKSKAGELTFSFSYNKSEKLRSMQIARRR